jgi:hypothetical protein
LSLPIAFRLRLQQLLCREGTGGVLDGDESPAQKR